jgi:D-inositol-3-phosphate glycosyltransferase
METMSDPTAPTRARIAVISLHTSPLDQPGTGDSGGMNVEIRALAERLGDRGVAIDVFTRCAGRGVPEVDRLGPLARVFQIPAGPCAPVDREALPELVPGFVNAVLDRADGEGPYDLIHAHYWLSGPAAAAARARWKVPLVASFHTLGEVKNLADGVDAPEPAARLNGERAAVRASDLVLVPTDGEAVALASLYDADPRRIRVVPPGVDPALFVPRGSQRAKERIGLSGPVALFVGRLQPLKAPDVAIRAVATARRLAPDVAGALTLLVVGGPSGSGAAAYLRTLRRLADDLGIADAVRFVSPRPHQALPDVYSAADVLLAPSRSESFGLASLEAQACGVPVVAAAVGGFRSVVAHGESGFLVPGHDPRAYAERLVEVLRDRALARRLSAAARRQALGYSWERTVAGVMEAYEELVPRPLSVAPAC